MWLQQVRRIGRPFPGKLNTAKNRKCVLCNKYGLQQSRIVRKNYQGTRDVWVHPKMKNFLLSGADNKNIKYQSNVKTGYCRFCHCCLGKSGDEGGWCKGVHDGRMHAVRTIEEDNTVSNEWQEAFVKFEEELYRGKVAIPDHLSYPTNDEERYELFKSTLVYQQFDEKFPEYRASIPVPHFHSGNVVDDIALHRKLHFTQFIADVAINPLIYRLEDVLEGHALLVLQVESAIKSYHILQRG